MTLDGAEPFVLQAVDLDGATVGTHDGHLLVTRHLRGETTDIEDVLELVADHGLAVTNVVTDVDAGEMRVWIDGGESA